MNNIKLENNYYLEVENNEIKNTNKILDIKDLKLKDIKNKKVILLKIDFNSFNEKEYKKILKHLLFIKSIINNKTEIGINKNNLKLLGYIFNYNEDDEKQKDFILAINAIFYNSRYERYNYIYDTVCDYLDNYFYGKNLCNFKDNQCGEKRETASFNGCCHHYKNKILGPFSKFVLCEHLKKDHTCGAKCISCKLFTCDYLENQGIKFRIKDILLLDTFFNPLQKYFIKYMVYTPKEKIIKRLMFF